MGRRSSVSRLNGVTTTYGYDVVSRLTSLSHNLSGTTNDQTYTYAYNPAGQIVSQTASNDLYAWTDGANGSIAYPINGLNQTGVNSGALPYDLKGNLLGDGTRTYTYDQANRLTSGGIAGGATTTLTYDALSRLFETTGTQGGRYVYDGNEIAGLASNGGATMVNRVVRGPWPDEVVAVHPTTAQPTFNLQDRLGSTVALTSDTGAMQNRLAYDEYGNPKSTNTGRFQYTGQLWLPDARVYHYKARVYHPGLGRFLQTDPIRYAAGANLYPYVMNDPTNTIDPSGLVQDPDVGDTWIFGSSCDVFIICVDIDLWRFLQEQRFTILPPYDLGEVVVTGTGEVIRTAQEYIEDTICVAPTIGLGLGADGYAGLGVSVGGGLNLDLANGRFRAGLNLGAGVGAGVNAGPQVLVAPSGGDVVSANVGYTVGGSVPIAPGLNAGGAFGQNLFGTNPGETGLSFGRAGTPSWFANVQASGALMTPSLYDLECE